MGCGCGKSFSTPSPTGRSTVTPQVISGQQMQAPQARVVVSQGTPYGTAPTPAPMKRVNV